MRQLYPGWLDQNRDRAYPFADASTLTSAAGDVLPVGVILDARLYAVGGGETQWLSRIRRDGDSARLTISGPAGILAEGDLQLSAPAEILPLEDSQGRPAGVLVLDPVQAPLLGAFADVTFPRTATRFCASVVVPVPAFSTRALACAGELLTGDVWVVGGPGVVWTEDAGRAVLNVVGDPYYRRRECQAMGSPFEEPRCLQTLQGLYPGAAGNIGICVGVERADSALRVSTRDGGLYLYFAGGRSP